MPSQIGNASANRPNLRPSTPLDISTPLMARLPKPRFGEKFPIIPLREKNILELMMQCSKN
jgi:hypothetical protein